MTNMPEHVVFGLPLGPPLGGQGVPCLFPVPRHSPRRLCRRGPGLTILRATVAQTLGNRAIDVCA